MMASSSQSSVRRDRLRLRQSLLSLGLGLTLAPSLLSQQFQLGDGGFAATPRQRVELATGAVEARAGQPTWVELRFRIQPGFHINSHDPRDETLIPTVLNFTTAGPVKVLQQVYPAGTPLHLDVGAGETLSTYQGEIRIRLQILATQGESALEGALRYQACDARSCFPPRKLPIQVQVSTR